MVANLRPSPRSHASAGPGEIKPSTALNAAPPSQSRLTMYLLELSRGSDPPDELSSPNRAHPFLGVILKRSKNCRTEQRGHGSAGAASTIEFGSWTVGGRPHAA